MLASSGSLLFFLDGDDLFYPNHVVACLHAMQSSDAGFVKTQVHIADPIHADWVKPINHSVVINLCIRRKCHDAVGGFPDFLLCRREREKLVPVTDIFFKFEDMYYNSLITEPFRGLASISRPSRILDTQATLSIGNTKSFSCRLGIGSLSQKGITIGSSYAMPYSPIACMSCAQLIEPTSADFFAECFEESPWDALVSERIDWRLPTRAGSFSP